MTKDTHTASVRASRYRVPRTRGAMSGLLLLILGAWAALAPMIGPYFNVAYTPAPNDAWHWTAARGWLEVLPGAAAFLGGLLLLVSSSRVMTMFGGWLAAAGGTWLIVGPTLADPLNLDLGTPDPSSSSGLQTLDTLLLFYGVGAAILFVAAAALGRLSVVSVRDVRAAERRVADEQQAPNAGTGYGQAPPATEDTTGTRAATGRHSVRDDSARSTTVSQTPQTEQQPYAQSAAPPPRERS
jgi:hypothetical protein